MPGELEATGVLVDRTTGKALCMVRFAATSSTGVSRGNPDALENDFRGQTTEALKTTLAAISPKLQLGAYNDFVH
jgi:hypothetical protein